jgi:YVTN family beta-propeller protein
VTASAGGTVTYGLFSGTSCFQGNLQLTTVKTVTAGSVPSAVFSVSTLTIGTYSLQATYSGDANNAPATSSCEATVTVIATPLLWTSISGSADLGSPVSDSAFLSNASPTAGGTVTYNLYGPGDGICASSLGIVQTVAVTVTADYVPPAVFTIGKVGTYSVQAVYGGDVNDAHAWASCEGPVYVTQTIPVGDYPWDAAFDPNMNEVFVANYESGSVSVISTVTKQVTAIPVGNFAYPAGVAFDPNKNEVFVTNFGSNTVSVISDATNRVTATALTGLHLIIIRTRST